MINGRLETSVHRTSGLDRLGNWNLIQSTFESGGKNRAVARAYGPAKAILNAGLTFDADGKPHPRHANVIGWDPLEKHVRKQQAVNFVSAFTFEMRPAERAEL